MPRIRVKGVDLFLHQQGLDTSTTAGKAMFQMLGVFAEFERGIIRERVNAGQDCRQRRTRGPATRGGAVPAIASALMDRVQAVVCLAESRRKADARGDVS